MALVALPTRRQARQIRELSKAGHAPQAITARVFGRARSWARHNVLVRKVLAEPEMFDPQDDPVAVDRALRGEASVFRSLTHYERREVMLTVHQRRREWDDDVLEEWTQRLTAGWGMSSRQIAEEARAHAVEAGLAAAAPQRGARVEPKRCVQGRGLYRNLGDRRADLRRAAYGADVDAIRIAKAQVSSGQAALSEHAEWCAQCSEVVP